ncbi:MAG: DUF3244 domain-containing protein [Alistipes sp.]|nr:DUF3244 domain-containing protein [Alistipes sp.]
MKKLFLLLLSATVMFAPCVFAEDNNNNNGNGNGDDEIPQTPGQTDNPVPVPLRPGTPLPLPPIDEPDTVPKPRSLSPISGLYLNGVVEIYFAADLGSASITVTSTTTGYMWCEESESCDGLISVNIGRAPGSYVVNIDTETAGSFIGQFTL